jgi:hypothetical protein
MTADSSAGRLLSVVAFVTLSTASVANAEPIGILLSWVVDRPQDATLSGAFPPQPLSLNTAKTGYELHYMVRRDGPYLQTASLDATFADGSTASLPVRLWPELNWLSATVFRIKYDICSPSDLDAAEQKAGTVQGALKALFTARALYSITGRDGCSPNNRKRAAKAWFDRSYELSLLANYFDYNAEAGAAYSNYDPAYVEQYRMKVANIGLKLINDQKKAALAAHNYSLASSLNESLLGTITGDDKTRQVALSLGRLSEAQLRRDHAWIASRSAKAGAAGRAIDSQAANTAPPLSTAAREIQLRLDTRS